MATVTVGTLTNDRATKFYFPKRFSPLTTVSHPPLDIRRGDAIPAGEVPLYDLRKKLKEIAEMPAVDKVLVFRELLHVYKNESNLGIDSEIAAHIIGVFPEDIVVFKERKPAEA